MSMGGRARVPLSTEISPPGARAPVTSGQSGRPVCECLQHVARPQRFLSAGLEVGVFSTGEYKTAYCSRRGGRTWARPGQRQGGGVSPAVLGDWLQPSSSSAGQGWGLGRCSGGECPPPRGARTPPTSRGRRREGKLRWLRPFCGSCTPGCPPAPPGPPPPPRRSSSPLAFPSIWTEFPGGHPGSLPPASALPRMGLSSFSLRERKSLFIVKCHILRAKSPKPRCTPTPGPGEQPLPPKGTGACVASRSEGDCPPPAPEPGAQVTAG